MTTFGLLVCVAALAAGSASAMSPPYVRGLVMQGYDPVAYWALSPTDDGVPGSPDFSHNITIKDTVFTFWLSSAENQAKFAADPFSYTPQFGGFCSWGMAREYPPHWPWSKDLMGPPGDPKKAWAIVDGKLFFNLSPAVRAQWLSEDNAGNIANATARFDSYFGGASTGPFNTFCTQDKATWPACCDPIKCDDSR